MTTIDAGVMRDLEALIDELRDPGEIETVIASVGAASPLSSPVALAVHCTRNFGPQARFIPYRWVRVLNGRLRKLAETPSSFQIIEAPVRAGKSLLGSRWFPAWYIGKHTDRRVALGGHNARFARSFGRQVREVVLSNPDVYGTRAIAWDQRAADDWVLAGTGGGMVSRGVGNPPTGMGFPLMMIDDPVKKREDAQSATKREKVWEWWTSDMRTRLEPGGSAIIIMSRWHEDDLVGRLLLHQQEEDPTYDGPIDHWDVLHLPAIANSADDPLGRLMGEALEPLRYDEVAYARIRHSVGELAWNSLYQNEPFPEEGVSFITSMWRYLPAMPAGHKWRLYWDLASTAKSEKSEDPDWTVGVLMTTTTDGFTLIGNVFRTRKGEGLVERFMADTARWCYETVGCTDVWVPQDPGAAGKLTVGSMRRHTFSNLPVRVHSDPVAGDKVSRAYTYMGAQQAGNIILIKGDWNTTFVEEHKRFPGTGTHDDQVDAAASGFNDQHGLLKPKAKVLV